MHIYESIFIGAVEPLKKIGQTPTMLVIVGRREEGITLSKTNPDMYCTDKHKTRYVDLPVGELAPVCTINRKGH